MNFNMAMCATAGSCIDGSIAVGFFVGVATCFAFGYGIGQAVLWVRRLSEVA